MSGRVGDLWRHWKKRSIMDSGHSWYQGSKVRICLVCSRTTGGWCDWSKVRSRDSSIRYGGIHKGRPNYGRFNYYLKYEKLQHYLPLKS